MMRNLYLLILLACTASLTYAQTTIWSENFNGFTAMPTTWTLQDNSGGGDWSYLQSSGRFESTTNDQGCVWFPSDNYGNDNQAEDADLISPTFSCTGYNTVYLEFQEAMFQFASSVGSASVSDDGGTTWTQVHSVNVTTANPNVVRVDVSQYLAGKANCKIKFNWTGDWDLYYYIDDIIVYEPVDHEIGIQSVAIDDYAVLGGSGLAVTGTITNFGKQTLTQFDLSYDVNGGTPAVHTFTGLSVPPLGTYNFTHPQNWNGTMNGLYDFDVDVSQPNNQTDPSPADNSISRDDVRIYEQASAKRTPVFEIFTSSTCGPCRPGNVNYHGIVDPLPDAHFVSQKYQQNFPGTGDPYCTDETVNRRTTPYGINSIPRMEINGLWDRNASSFTQALYNEARAEPSWGIIGGTYTNDTITKTISWDIVFTTNVDINTNDAKLFINIYEELTTANVKSNGETEFEEVVKKMIPNQNGANLPAMSRGATYRATGSYTFNGNYRLPADGQTANRINHATEHSVEEFGDLHVAAWIQYNGNRFIMNGANLVQTNKLNMTTVTSTEVQCTAASGSITASAAAANGPVEYSIDGGNNWQSSGAFGGLSAGVYTVLARDADEYQIADTITVDSAQVPEFGGNTITNNSLCGSATGSIVVDATGVGPLEYSTDGSNYQLSNTLASLGSGNYTVYVRDANSCVITKNFVINDSNGPTLSDSKTDVLCNGDNNGTITLSATGGQMPYEYSEDGTLTWQTSGSFSGLAPGTYSCVVRDNNGCITSKAVTITEPDVLAVSLDVSDENCGASDGAIDLTVTGGTTGYSYAWSNGANTQDISGVNADNYSVTVTDANNCTVSGSDVMGGSSNPTVTLTPTNQDALQFNGSVTSSVSGGSGIYSYTWSTTATTADLSNLQAGTYTVTVVDAVSGCQAIESATVGVNPNVGINGIEEIASITVFPNPAAKVVVVEYDENKIADARFELINILGETVINTASSQLDVSNLASGNYMLNIYSGDKHAYSHKVQVHH